MGMMLARHNLACNGEGALPDAPKAATQRLREMD